jgi:iron complex outermembrane receptor protein
MHKRSVISFKKHIQKCIAGIVVFLIFTGILMFSVPRVIAQDTAQVKFADSLPIPATEDTNIVIGTDILNGASAVIHPGSVSLASYFSPDQLLMGKAAGVMVIQGDGAPGSASEIYIRGVSDFYYFNQPLIVLNDVPLINDELNTLNEMSNPLNTINPADIDNIEVIKDGTAMALYGVLAANGAIVIKTKKGSTNQPLQLAYLNSFSLGTVSKKQDVYHPDEYRTLINQRFAGQDSITGLLGKASTDWQDEIYQPAFGHNHHLSATGGIRFLPYRVSFGYSDQEGVLKTDRMKRFTYSANVNPVFFDEHLSIHLYLSGNRFNNTIANRDAIQNALLFDPTQAVYDANSPFGGYTTSIIPAGYSYPEGIPVPGAPYNPVAMLEMNSDQARFNHRNIQYGLQYKIHGLPKLNLNLSGAYAIHNSDRQVVIPENAPWKYVTDYKRGYSSSDIQKLKTNYLEYHIGWDQYFESGSQLNLKAGSMFQSWSGDWEFASSRAHGIDFTSEQGSSKNSVLFMFYGASYTYHKKYTLAAYYTSDYISQLENDNSNQGNFITSAAWRISHEKFMETLSWVEELNLRFSYNTMGKKSSRDRPSSLMYMPTTASINAGIDFGFFKNRMVGSLDFYKKKTNDFLHFLSVPAGSQLGTALITNVGDIENSGVELSMGATIIEYDKIKWNLSFNFAYNHNTVTSLDVPTNNFYPGIPGGDFYGQNMITTQILTEGHPANSFFLMEQVYDENGEPIEGLYANVPAGSGYMYGQYCQIGNSIYPDAILGFGSLFKLNRWEVYFSGRFFGGHEIYDKTEADYSPLNGMVYDNFGPDVLVNRVRYDGKSPFNTTQFFSDYYARNAAFLRLDDLSLSHRLNPLMKGHCNVKVYLSVHNLFTLSHYKGVDPEVQAGLDQAEYPRPRTYMAGLIVQFQ